MSESVVSSPGNAHVTAARIIPSSKGWTAATAPSSAGSRARRLEPHQTLAVHYTELSSVCEIAWRDCSALAGGTLIRERPMM